MEIFIALDERNLKTVVQVLLFFVLQCTVDDIFQFDFFPVNYLIVCIVNC